jgi:hypothetical protein
MASRRDTVVYIMSAAEWIDRATAIMCLDSANMELIRLGIAAVFDAEHIAHTDEGWQLDTVRRRPSLVQAVLSTPIPCPGCRVTASQWYKIPRTGACLARSSVIGESHI